MKLFYLENVQEIKNNTDLDFRLYCIAAMGFLHR